MSNNHPNRSRTTQTYGLVFERGDILAPGGYLDTDEHAEDCVGWPRTEALAIAGEYSPRPNLTRLARVKAA
ncbi:MAG: hypothetical protein NUV51_03685 [Sulfuricaulis sp.]|nr:hypothetical protein [Sulfuricaulis sp.]